MKANLHTAVIQNSGGKLLAVLELDIYRESREVNQFINVFINYDNFIPVIVPASEEEGL